MIPDSKGDYTEPNTIQCVIIPHNPMDLVCVDFTKVGTSKESKENILVLTDIFTKFSQAFITPNRKTNTIVKILVDKWFYVYRIPVHIHCHKGQSFDNEIITHLYAMYGVDQWTTTPYNPHGNAPNERLKDKLIDLFKLLPKEQKGNWPIHLPSLMFAYNAMPHSTTSYQPYKLISDAKHQLLAMHGLGWQIIMITFHIASVHVLINNMNSPLLQTGGH